MHSALFRLPAVSCSGNGKGKKKSLVLRQTPELPLPFLSLLLIIYYLRTTSDKHRINRLNIHLEK